jgi:hypothetical protein
MKLTNATQTPSRLHCVLLAKALRVEASRIGIRHDNGSVDETLDARAGDKRGHRRGAAAFAHDDHAVGIAAKLWMRRVIKRLNIDKSIPTILSSSILLL